ncbi:MAG TPA: hypothetical protein VGE27_04290 [Gemmatimonas sp.]|uniref:hypothetical protein n=1 Tax=Gemmatimonas sp. TaxID=1962908 RepID=UPI002ED9E750
MPADRFFRHHAPDASLDLQGVEEDTGYIGRIEAPSGAALSGWYAASELEHLHRRLHEVAADLLGPIGDWPVQFDDQ